MQTKLLRSCVMASTCSQNIVLPMYTQAEPQHAQSRRSILPEPSQICHNGRYRRLQSLSPRKAQVHPLEVIFRPSRLASPRLHCCGRPACSLPINPRAVCHVWRAFPINRVVLCITLLYHVINRSLRYRLRLLHRLAVLM